MANVFELAVDHSDPTGTMRVYFFCPGCEERHAIRVSKVPTQNCWGFNQDMERPTLSPSVLVKGVKRMTKEEHQAWVERRVLPTPIPFVCHSFINDGNIQFLNDCTHPLAGKTVPLEPIPQD